MSQKKSEYSEYIRIVIMMYFNENVVVNGMYVRVRVGSINGTGTSPVHA